MAHVVLRIELDSEASIGGDAIRLLELVEIKGSITAAARAHGLKFRRAWTLLDEINRMFKTPALIAQPGGLTGGGARLTPFGREIVDRYRAIEAATAQATARELAALQAAAQPQAPKAR